MKKKFLYFLLTFFTIILLSGCSASDDYLGKWFAINQKGEKFIIDFEGNSFTISDDKEKNTYSFTQNRTGSSNGIRYFGIEIEGRGSLTIAFPDNKDKTYALFIEPTSSEESWIGNIIFTITRDKYPEKFHSVL